ncbi:beta-1,6-N-acetylglucosaminyltransferase [Paraburkholderia caffeinilytica]|uniref:beta-1,6-N-acetylglucosaminyltransferase n=1 Tax=Paraburkholderia caffeinilytica TaxID=1761016 RepID=UPI003DA1307C
MNIAFLIVAHRQFAHVDRLLGALSQSNTTCYLHVDAKVTPLPQLRNKAVLTAGRLNVQWAGFSQVEATLELMRTAVKNSAHDYFILLSGADYPIRPISELTAYLSLNQRDCINLTEFGRLGKSIDRVRVRYLEGGGGRNRGGRAAMSRCANRFFSLAYRLVGARRKLPPGFSESDFRAGSSWFGLKKDTIEAILEFVDRRPDFVRYCASTSFSDEFFFQTIMHKCGLDNNLRPNLHYADWEKGAPPYPSELTGIHLEDLVRASVLPDGYGPERPVFFARKFGTQSSALLEQLDEKLALLNPFLN